MRGSLSAISLQPVCSLPVGRPIDKLHSESPVVRRTYSPHDSRVVVLPAATNPGLDEDA